MVEKSIVIKHLNIKSLLYATEKRYYINYHIKYHFYTHNITDKKN